MEPAKIRKLFTLWSLSATLLISCHQKDQEVGLSDELYSRVMEYQKRYPIPKNREARRFVYEAHFYRSGRDTFLSLTRLCPAAGAGKGEKVLGPYSDALMAPTLIRDDENLYSKAFIKTIVEDAAALRLLGPEPGKEYPESFPPIHHFQVSNGTITPLRIDTVWTAWAR